MKNEAVVSQQAINFYVNHKPHHYQPVMRANGCFPGKQADAGIIG